MDQAQLYSNIVGEGKPLLILHGFLGMSDNWKSIGAKIAEQGFQVHMLDLRNHGRSFHSDVFTYEAMANDVKHYCDTHQLFQIALLGHSMGGKVAMHFAGLYPEKLTHLIVADIGVKYYPPHHQQILDGLDAVDFSVNPDRNAVDDTLKNYIKEFGVRQFLMKSLYWKTQEQLAFRFNLPVFMTQYDAIGEALQADVIYTAPTLFIKGEKSPYILEEDKIQIRKHFPETEFKTIPQAGHWLHAENPDLFTTFVLEFLKS